MSVRWTLMAVSAVLAVVCVFMICDADGSDADSASGQCGDNLSWSMTEGCVTFTGSGDMWDYPHDMARGWEACSSVILPPGLTHIGEHAFYHCSSLASVTIPDSVTSIGDRAFDGCSSLASLTIGNSVSSIGNEAFDGCTSLASVTLPDSVTSIGGLAFYGCTSLASVTLPDSVTSIGEFAFYYCLSLASVTIGNSVTSIGNFAFEECTLLESVTIPDSVTSIGEGAFYRCSSLESVTIGNSVTAIGEGAFKGCTSLESVTIGNSVTAIGESAFRDCIKLKSVTIPDSVTTIETEAFYSCDNLEEVNVACPNPLNITKGNTSNGYVAYYAANVNLCHPYSATYGWSDDGKSCTVHIICANTANHNHDEPAAVTSKVKIPPTETEMGTTEYSVSGTYDGFAYSDTKDVQDIPPTGHHDDPSTHRYDRFPALALTLSIFASLGLVGGVILFSRFRI